MGELEETLQNRRDFVDTAATDFRGTRDGWNAKTRENLTERNSLNTEVRDLLPEVKKQRTIRDEENERVREMKVIRDDCNDKVRSAKRAVEDSRSTMHGASGGGGGSQVNVHTLKRDLKRLDDEIDMGYHSSDKKNKAAMERVKLLRRQIKDLSTMEIDNQEVIAARTVFEESLEAQEVAHEQVTEAAKQAQSAHELMLEWNKEISKRRDRAEDAHRKLRVTKKEADLAHHQYIVALRCLHSLNNMLKTMKTERRSPTHAGEPDLRVDNLMEKLLAGETLSTEELMQLQRMG